MKYYIYITSRLGNYSQKIKQTTDYNETIHILDDRTPLDRWNYDPDKEFIEIIHCNDDDEILEIKL